MARIKILNSKISLLILISLLGFFAFSLNQAIGKKRATDQKLASLQEELKELHSYQENLSKEKKYFQSQDFIEKEARRILNYQKPGEKVFAVIPPKGIFSSQNPETFQETKHQIRNNDAFSQSNLHKWLDYFFRHN